MKKRIVTRFFKYLRQIMIFSMAVMLFFSGITPRIQAESQVIDTYEISLDKLGYGEKVLYSPSDAVEYELRLPEEWAIQAGSAFTLDTSYIFIGTNEWTNSTALFFGAVTVSLRGQILSTWTITQTTIDHLHLSIPLPTEILNSENRVFNIQIKFDLDTACNLAQDARLIVHPDSFFSLVYTKQPIVADLGRYPRPFVQRTFERDLVRFVLPEQPTQSELETAATIAARLGRLAYGIAISGTTDVEAMTLLQTQQPPEEHLILIGRPDAHALIAELARFNVLPVMPVPRRSLLNSTGPTVTAPGDLVTFTVSMTYTGHLSRPVMLADSFPQGTRMVSCIPTCTVKDTQAIWAIPSTIRADDALSYTLVLRVGEVLTDVVLENKVILFDHNNSPLNVNTLTTTVSSTRPPTNTRHSTTSWDHGVFFAIGDQAVAEGDGILQEIISPWNPAHAILVVTGLTDEAVSKAGRALGSSLRFPALEGPFALIQEARLPDALPPEWADEQTFEDLGYQDRILKGLSQEISYYFTVLPGWQLTTNAYLDLEFNHSALLDYTNSSLTVLLNGNPIASTGFSAETAQNGRLRAYLGNSYWPGRSNRLSIVAKMASPDRCAPMATWVTVKQSSRLYLEHTQASGQLIDLKYYPYPFNQQAGLYDTMYVLPSDPLPLEWEAMLRLAATMGQAVGGTEFAPTVWFADVGLPNPSMLSAYHLVVIGRPLRNPLLQQINAGLPQPFLPNTDQIEQRLNQVVLRLPPNLSLGYLQLIDSPWNAARVLLAVTGTSDEGVQWAVDALASQSWSLAGNLSLVREKRIQTIDTRLLTRSGMAMALKTAVPEVITQTITLVEPTVTSTLPLTGTTTVSERDSTITPVGQTPPRWLVPFVVVMGIAIAGILGAAIWQTGRQSGIKR